MDGTPSITLVGFGSGNGLQLTLDGQKALARARKVYTVAPTAAVRSLLKSLRVQDEDLSERFAEGRSFSDCYLEIADLLLRRAAEEPPIAFLTPGSPLFLNSLNRFLVMHARDRGLRVEVVPGVSQLDAIISELGIDVSTFGLQVFDATRLVQRAQRINPEVPAILLQIGGFGLVTVNGAVAERAAEAYLPLVRHLAGFYRPEFRATLIGLGAGGAPSSRITRPLAAFPELVPHVTAYSHLFLDAVRPGPGGEP
ncbi:MAG TPA: SAM-dependent methyltransferase [Dehalococcoidia bacterium]